MINNTPVYRVARVRVRHASKMFLFFVFLFFYYFFSTFKNRRIENLFGFYFISLFLFRTIKRRLKLNFCRILFKLLRLLYILSFNFVLSVCFTFEERRLKRIIIEKKRRTRINRFSIYINEKFDIVKIKFHLIWDKYRFFNKTVFHILKKKVSKLWRTKISVSLNFK